MAAYRSGNWLFAIHRSFTLLPNGGLYTRNWWSIWWLWFEIGYAKAETDNAR